MAVRVNTTEEIHRSTTMPSITAFTLMAWVYPSVDTTAGFQGAISIGNTTNLYILGYGNSAGTLKTYVYNNTDSPYGTTVSVATWFHLALTCAGTGANLLLSYVNGVLDETRTGHASVPATTLQFGTTLGSDTMDGRLAALKVYGAVLTANEIAQEMRAYTPVRVANLLTWHPMLLHTDLSQYGATFTATGTLSTEDGPPIAWSLAPMRQNVWGAAAAATIPGDDDPWLYYWREVA
jgi:hypothetical protein